MNRNWTRSIRWGGALSALMIIFFVAAPAFASGDPDALFDQLSEDEEQQVILLIDEGQEAYDDGDFDTALDRFEAVYELFPHPDVIYRIGLCYERIGDDELAIQRYRQFLKEMPDASDRGRIERTIETLEERLGDDLSTLRVQTQPEGAFVYVNETDSVPAGQTPVDVALEPGDYRIYIEKPGYESLQEDIDVERGETVRLQMRLSEEEGSEEEDEETSDEAGESRRSVQLEQSDSGRHWWNPVISSALFGIGGLGVYQARVYHREYEQHVATREAMSGGEGSSEERQRRAEVERDRDQARMMRNGMAVVGGAALVGGALYTTWWIARGSQSSGAVIGVAPGLDGGVHFGVRGHF